jgi:hypothetical protein
MLKNSKLQNCFKLGSKITVYIPSTVDINKKIDSKRYVDQVASLFSECFGGSTSTPALGYWLSNTVGLVKEKTTLVFSYCNSEQLEQHTDKIIEYCEQLKKELSQDAIALEINGEMYFI